MAHAAITRSPPPGRLRSSLYQVLANKCSPREIRLFERRLDWYTCKRELRVPVHVCTFRVAVGARRPHRKSNLRKSLLFLTYELPTCADRRRRRIPRGGNGLILYKAASAVLPYSFKISLSYLLPDEGAKKAR